MPWQNNGGGWQGGGGRNPWGQGPGGPQGPQPPNIDEMIRRGQERLKGVLPGGVGGKSGIVLLIAILLGLWAFTGLYRVQPDEQGVVLRFGEYVRQVGDGLHYHLPWPIETVTKPKVEQENRVDIGYRSIQGSGRNVRQATFDEESLMLTGDENIVDINFAVFWRIRNAGQFLFNIQSPQEVTIKAVAESAMREVIGKTPIQVALTEGRLSVEQETQELLQRTLDDYEAGVTITQVKLEQVDPPAQVIDAFRDVQAAEADRERYRNEADAYANNIIPEARGTANRMVQEAEAYKEQVIAKASGEASRFSAVYEEYAKAKDVTKKRIYLETMEDILENMDKIIIDDEAGSGIVPYLPLPEVEKRRGRGGESGND
ncbi:MAG: FtsH protease activity modulator HflK [Sphingomonadales bacterium]|nr:FtsH protease activity modulator HflK [Sphingomonadales bacterium]